MNFTELLRTTSLLKLIAALSLVAVVAIFTTVASLYWIVLKQEGQLLADSVSNQITLMRTMQRLSDEELVKDENSDGKMIFNAIRNMQQMNTKASALGKSREFVVAQRRGDMIEFILWGTHASDVNTHYSVPFSSELAEPMRRALSGETGTLTGLDYKGNSVLAAYDYMPEYGLGIAYKINTDVLLVPFLQMIALVSLITVVFVFVGAYSFAIVVRPFYERQEQHTKRLHRQHEIMARLVERKDVDPCNMEKIFEEITEASSEGLGITRASIWLYSQDRCSLHCADSFDRPSGTHDVFDDFVMERCPVLFRTLQAGPLSVDDHASTDSRTLECAQDYLLPNRTQALLCKPIWVEGTEIGYLCNEQSDTAREWTIEDRNFARSIAERIAMAMANCKRNKAEHSLKESEERYELAVNGSSDGLWDWDIASNRVYRSPQYHQLLGYEAGEYKDDYSTWLEHLHPDDLPRVKAAIAAHLEDSNTPYDTEYRLLTKSGEYRWFRGRGIALRDEGGKPYRVSGSVTDITELKQIQDSLSRFKQTLGEISENIYMFDPDTLKFFYVNRSAIEDSGFSEDELLEMTPLDIKPEFNEKTFREMLAALVTSPERSLVFETTHRHKDGSIHPVEVNLQYIEPSNASPRFVGVVRDITERRNAEVLDYMQRTMLEQIYLAQDGFISGVSRGVVYERLINGILDITESEFGLIGEVIYTDGEPVMIRTRQISDLAWSDESRLRDSAPVREITYSKDSLLGEVITTGEGVIVNDFENASRISGLPDGHTPLESFMGLPLLLGKKLIGIVAIANRVDGYSEDMPRQLQPLMSTCANLLEAEKDEALRNQMENDLRNSEEQANTVLATVADGIITIDENGTVGSFNRAAEIIFGYSADEVVGRNVSLLMPAPYNSAHDGYLQRYLATGDARILGTGREVDGKRKDGSIFPMDLSVSEMRLGTERRYTGVVRDISDRKHAEIALIAARDEAEQANRAKSEFLSSMSHELRTPLNAIMGFAQLLQFDKGLSDAQKKHVKVIYSAGGLLLDLINDVLDLAKIEAGYIDLTIESVMLEPVFQDTFKLVRPLAKKHAIKLSYETRTAEHNGCNNVWVSADRTRLKQVLLNLLSNAIKYNRSNGTVHVSCPPAAEGFCRICITDSGRGLSERDIEHLFQPFNRLGAQHGDIEGTGIGLVITRKLVELMGGSISVQSEHGKGTSFMIDLPAADAVSHERVDEKKQELVQTDRHEGKRILVAEDNLTNQELIALQLDALGYQSDIVTNGAEAASVLGNRYYDLLLTDIHMPKMDGYDLTRIVRSSSDAHVKDMVIIAITANVSVDEATRCIEAGMNDVISKPVNINELQDKLNLWLGDKEARLDNLKSAIADGDEQQDNVVAQPVSVPVQAGPAIDTELLSRYVGSNPDKQIHFFRLFLSTAPETITAIHRAYKKRAGSDIAGACHKLKSSARAIGAANLANVCQQIETAAQNGQWALLDEIEPNINEAMEAVEKYITALLVEKEIKQEQFSFDDVLLVDDDLFVLDLIAIRLNSLGITNVMKAFSGEEALSYIKNAAKPPDLLLLDLNMPGMDGVEFLRHLSEQAYQGNIILVSAEDARLLRSVENIARDRHLNILGALEKPVNIAPLTRLLRMANVEQAVRPKRDKVEITEEDIRNCIANDELVVYYQPQIDIASRKLSGVEALVRWIHPQRGMIPPDAFVPLAEELDLINEMTDIILNKAMAQCARWNEQGLDINLSVNLSVDSLDRLDLPEYIVSCARANRIDVSKLMLEITESRLMQDITSALDILTRLSLKGIGLSIDDFGTGYSSMEQLQRVPFKELKIDRSFVNGALNNRAARAILESSVELARKLNMTVVAEGVETDEDMDLVAGLGYTSAQGYLIAKPMPGDELLGWHEDWKSRI